MLRQVLRFGFVGVLATLVHILVGVTLIHSGWPPLLANAVSFLIAFLVSFMGHFGFSFVDQPRDPATALRRFACVACAAFLFNEAALALLLSHTALHPMPALCVSTVLTAVGTFILSRNWAFRAPDHAHSLGSNSGGR